MNNTVKTVLCAAVTAIGIQAACAAGIKPLNSIAAEVNGNIITYGDIERTATILRQNAGSGVSQEQLLTAARQNLLERALLTDAARMQGLKATAAEIDNEIVRRAELAGRDVKSIYAEAARMGWNQAQYRVEVAKDLLIERMMANLEDGIKVSEEDIDRAITQATQEGRSLPATTPYTVYRIRRILLNINQNNTASAVGKRMALIAQAVQQGNDFAALARRYSQEKAAADGGLMEVSGYALPAKIQAFLPQMKNGQAAIPIQTADSWQMVQLVDKREESDLVKMQREAVRRQLLQQERQKAQQQFMGQIQTNAVVREY